MTAKVMPAPKVPVTPERAEDVEEEPQVWGARKLRPIGIGIAALLAISLSYMGVKALTKPSVKPPRIIAKTNETAAPQKVAAAESVPPVLTTPAAEAGVTESVAPPNQSPENSTVTSGNSPTESNPTESVAPLNQDATANVGAAPNVPPPGQTATGNLGATKQQDGNAQSTSRTQPVQPPIPPKTGSGNAANTSGQYAVEWLWYQKRELWANWCKIIWSRAQQHWSIVVGFQRTSAFVREISAARSCPRETQERAST